MSTSPPTKRRGRPSSKQAAELTSSIISTALRMFLEQGYETTSMDAVAVACRVSKHTVYRRYPSKALLFQDALELHTHELVSELQTAAPRDADSIEAIRQAAKVALTFATSPSAIQMFRICIGAVTRFPEVGAQLASVEERILDFLEPHVRHAQDEGRIHPGPSRRIATHLYYALTGESWSHVLNGAAVPEEVLSDEAFEEAWVIAMRGFAIPA